MEAIRGENERTPGEFTGGANESIRQRGEKQIERVPAPGGRGSGGVASGPRGGGESAGEH